MPLVIPHWIPGHQAVHVAVSRGGRHAALNISDVLIRPAGIPWLPPELAQKCSASQQVSAFEERDDLTASLGHYCDLQSLASEDALTWNVFGPIVYAPADVRAAFIAELCKALGLVVAVDAGGTHVWLWRRVPHPGNQAPGGPEIDVGIYAGDVLILIEAKWLSEIGRGQGTAKDQDQVELREIFCREGGRRLFPNVSSFVILGLGREPGAFGDRFPSTADAPVALRELTWERVCGLPSHPAGEELLAHLRWKEEHGGPTGSTRRAAVRQAGVVAP